MIDVEDSSVPFRAFLGTILSVVETVSVEPSKFNPNMKLDLVEEQDEGHLPEDVIGNGSACSASSEEEMVNDPLNTRNGHRTGQKNAEPGLMVCPCAACHLLFALLIYS